MASQDWVSTSKWKQSHTIWQIWEQMYTLSCFHFNHKDLTFLHDPLCPRSGPAHLSSLALPHSPTSLSGLKCTPPFGLIAIAFIASAWNPRPLPLSGVESYSISTQIKVTSRKAMHNSPSLRNTLLLNSLLKNMSLQTYLSYTFIHIYAHINVQLHIYSWGYLIFVFSTGLWVVCEQEMW